MHDLRPNFDQEHFLFIENNLVEIFTNKNVNFVPFAIGNFRQIGRHDKIENLLFLVHKENLSLDVLNLDTYAGYPTHLIFNQNFKIITGLLENLDRADETKVANLLKREDTADYSATILDAASLMGSVATPEFLNVVTKLYSALASDHPSFIKLKEYSFMLPSKNFKEIFTEDYLKSLSEEKYTELSKMTSALLLKIQSSEEIWKRDLEKFMEGYDLNPCVNFRKNGYDGTTLENLNQFQAMYHTLIRGGCISIKKEGDSISLFKKYMVQFAGISYKEANRWISDESKVTLVEGNIQGSVPLGDGSTIFSFIEEQIKNNLEYIKNNLDKIKESKVSPRSSGVAEPQTQPFLGIYQDRRLLMN